MNAPWRLELASAATHRGIVDSGGKVVADAISRPVAERIVCCVNVHDDLIAALKAVLSMHCMPLDGKAGCYRDNIGAFDQARSALAKVSA